MDKTVRIAVLLSAYNGELFIREQLDTLLNQDLCRPYEVYVRDDGSSDNTVEIVNGYVRDYPEMFHWIVDNKGNLGPKKSFLTLMEAVDSDYYLFCDQDDIWFKDKIKMSIKCLSELEDSAPEGTPCCIFTTARVSAADGKTIIDENLWHYAHVEPAKAIKDIYHNVVYTDAAFGCTMAFNDAAKSKVKTDRRIDKAFGGHDEVICYACLAYGRISYITTPTMVYRRTGSNASDVRNIKNTREMRSQGGFMENLSVGWRAFVSRRNKLHILGVRPINYLKLFKTFAERYFE